ncbi:DUF1684 domain-containing protein [Candidatus Latescibacterota bacterium]
MRHGAHSPLLPEQRPSFEGLLYYPVDVRFRMEGQIHMYGRQRRIAIPASGDTTALVDRFGRFVSQFAGSPFSLEIYRSVEEGRLSVFFTDQTNGTETYGGGRYAPVRHLDGERYLIDFNEAYSPYCAYNPSYVCPLPPPQNRLPFAVRAGERGYGPHLAD